MVTTCILQKIKKRLGLSENISVYDEELIDLIDGALFDMQESGVPAEMLDAPCAQVINCVVFFVKRERAEDNKTASWYDKMYEKTVFRLSLCDGGDVR